MGAGVMFGFGTIWSLAALPDGGFISGDDKIRIWRRGARPVVLEAPTGMVWALRILPDGTLASSGSFDGTIRLWDLTKGVECGRLEGHASSVRALAMLEDGRLASGSEDRTIRLWDLGLSIETDRLEGHKAEVRALAVLQSGHLVSGSHDKTIRIWDLASGSEVTRLEIDAEVNCLLALKKELQPPNLNVVAGDGVGRVHWFEVIN
jgi:WD40 repeat protein